jgi:hypothetical protein
MVECDSVPERNFLLVFQEIPVDIEEIKMGVSLVFPGNSRAGNEPDGSGDVSLASAKLPGGLGHADFTAIEDVGHQG